MKRIGLIVWLSWIVGWTWAQSAQVVYTCDFENQSECGQWDLNVVANTQQANALKNKWYIGASGDFSANGQNGLFISSDNGQNAVCDGSQTMFVVASRDMDTTLAAGNYVLRFYWRANTKSVTGEGIYVCWVPVGQRTNSAGNAGALPQWVKTYRVDSLSASSTWTVANVPIVHDGTAHKLVFVWYSTRGTVLSPSGCIDGIELAEKTDCQDIVNVSHVMRGDTVEVRWGVSMNTSDVVCYNPVEETWHQGVSTSGNSAIVTGVSEGVQTFFIKTECADGPVDWVAYTTFVYHKGKRCIDYMDLNNRNCYIGTYENPFETACKVDSGFANMASRHTLHYMPDEWDANTNYALKTCPNGYLTSVRLGWGEKGQGGHKGHGIKYNYKVGAQENGILKIKYAVVLEDGHEPKDNPRFWLDVKVNGRKIPNDCGYAFFKANDGAHNGWRTGADGWVWKDWSEQAINLRDYVGQNLTIELATTDCSATVHVGYVYFVLDCESGELEGMNCGEDNPTTDLQAPSGFNYAWYAASDMNTILSDSQSFHIQPMDTATYYVNVINKSNPQCWYTLTACGMPRIPVPQVTYEVGCNNMVTFHNSSCVYVQDMNETDASKQLRPSVEKVTSLAWDFGDGSPIKQDLSEDVSHQFPYEGGDFAVVVAAGISQDACVVSDTIYLHLSQSSTEEVFHLCREEYPFGLSYNGKTYYENYESNVTFQTADGCDSVVHVQINFYEKGPYPYGNQQGTDTICEGENVQWFEREIAQSGVYDTVLYNRFGCDSIVRYKVYVDPKLEDRIADTIRVCADYASFDLPIDVVAGRYDGVVLRFDDDTTTAGGKAWWDTYQFSKEEVMSVAVPKDLQPGYYMATLDYVTPLCEATKRICIEYVYSSQIFYQNNGILAIMNAAYNGGHEFVGYRWYRDGEWIADTSEPYLSVGTDDIGHIYYAQVKRAEDGVWMNTCEVVYGLTDIDKVSETEIAFPAKVYTIVGAYVGTFSSSEQMKGLVQGVYVVQTKEGVKKVVEL